MHHRRVERRIPDAQSSQSNRQGCTCVGNLPPLLRIQYLVPNQLMTIRTLRSTVHASMSSLPVGRDLTTSLSRLS